MKIEERVFLLEKLVGEALSILVGLNNTRRTNKPITIRQMEKNLIITSLARHSNNRTRTAKELGIGRVTLIDKMRRYGIVAESNSGRPHD